MLNKILAGAEKAINFYKVAPYAETVCFYFGVHAFMHREYQLVVGVDLLGILYCTLMVGERFKFKKRLEKSVERFGYDDRIFKTSLKEWCDRQTARVVAKNSGNLDDYIALCNDTKDIQSLPNLKNF